MDPLGDDQLQLGESVFIKTEIGCEPDEIQESDETFSNTHSKQQSKKAQPIKKINEGSSANVFTKYFLDQIADGHYGFKSNHNDFEYSHAELETQTSQTTRQKFSFQEEEKIIDFVKNHEILFNVRNSQFRDSEAKHRLWLKLGKQMNRDAEIVRKKWNSMRDYFVRNKDKKTTGLAITKRDESLMFLLDMSILKRTTLNNISSSGSVSSMSSEAIDEVSTFVTYDDMTPMVATYETTPSDDNRLCASSVPVFKETPRLSQKSTVPSEDHTGLLREFLNRKQRKRIANPMYFEPPKPPAPKDNLQQFFESIASTMRTFPPLSIAKLKLEISQMVGREEIACAERNTNGHHK